MILLDTNVVSEAFRAKPSGTVIRWMDRHFTDCALSTISVFELGVGVAQMPSGHRRDILNSAIGRLVQRFGPRLYAFDLRAAGSAGRLWETSRQRGLSLHQGPSKMADLQIGAIASAYALTLATRNTRDFAGLDLVLIDPWTAEPNS